MKTAIKLVLIYFLMQIVGALFAGPFCLLYTYFAYGTFDMDKAGQIAVAPTMRWALFSWDCTCGARTT